MEFFGCPAKNLGKQEDRERPLLDSRRQRRRDSLRSSSRNRGSKFPTCSMLGKLETCRHVRSSRAAWASANRSSNRRTAMNSFKLPAGMGCATRSERVSTSRIMPPPATQGQERRGEVVVPFGFGDSQSLERIENELKRCNGGILNAGEFRGQPAEAGMRRDAVAAIDRTKRLKVARSRSGSGHRDTP